VSQVNPRKNHEMGMGYRAIGVRKNEGRLMAAFVRGWRDAKSARV